MRVQGARVMIHTLSQRRAPLARDRFKQCAFCFLVSRTAWAVCLFCLSLLPPDQALLEHTHHAQQATETMSGPEVVVLPLPAWAEEMVQAVERPKTAQEVEEASEVLAAAAAPLSARLSVQAATMRWRPAWALERRPW